MKIALLWRGSAAEWAGRVHEARQWPIIQALRSMGAVAEPMLYEDSIADAVRDKLLSVDLVLVWVNPLDPSGDRTTLDAMLRAVAARGISVSAHPDVIAKIGVKEVLYATREMDWGSDVDRYADAESLSAGFPRRLSSGPRVLKPNKGNGGQNVWRVELLAVTPPPLSPDALVSVLEAGLTSVPKHMTLGAFLDRWRPYLEKGGVLIDQEYHPRLSEGMTRCYLCGSQVVGFGHQLITALLTPVGENNQAALPAPGPRIMFSPDADRFADLRAMLENRWIPELQRLLAITDEELPLLWDADFLLRRGATDAAREHVLCEINASSVAPFPESAVLPLAAAAIGRAAGAARRRGTRDAPR